MRHHAESHVRTHYPEGVPTKLKDVLEDCRVRERKIRIVLGDPETGKVWLEENDVVGYLGRSTGTQRALLMLSNKSAIGGPAVSVENILGVMHYSVAAAEVQFLYAHANLKAPMMTVLVKNCKEYPYQVATCEEIEMVGGTKQTSVIEVIANCKSEPEATELKKFHQLKRLTPPAYTTVIGIEIEGVIDDPEEFQHELTELLKQFKNKHEVRKYCCTFDTSKPGKWVKTA
jgi:hypothetical protein